MYNPNELAVCSYCSWCNSKNIVPLTEEHYKSRKDDVFSKASDLSYSEQNKLFEETLREDFAKHSEFYDKEKAYESAALKAGDEESMFPTKVCSRGNSRFTYGGPWSKSETFGQIHVTNKYFCCKGIFLQEVCFRFQQVQSGYLPKTCRS